MTVVNFAVADQIKAQIRDGSSAPDRIPNATPEVMGA